MQHLIILKFNSKEISQIMLKNSKIQFENPELKIVFYENLNFNTEKYDGMKLIGNTKIKRRINNNSAIVNFRLNIGEDNDKFPFIVF